MSEPRGLIASFARHQVAANLLMVLMIMLGLLGWHKLNTQLFPDFDFDYVTVTIPWRGASPEDIQRSITIPVEQALKTLPDTRKLIARSQQGAAAIFIELEDGSDIGLALDEVRQRIDSIRNLPQDAERPVIQKITPYTLVTSILVSTDHGTREELRPVVRKMEDELLALGVGKVEFVGLPDEEMAIQVPTSTLHDLGLTLNQIASQVRDSSQDIPAGTVGRDDAAKQLRALGQRRDEKTFADLPLLDNASGKRLTLGDVAIIKRRPRDDQATLTYQGKPAIELRVMQGKDDDMLDLAAKVQTWAEGHRHDLPQGVHMTFYFQTWKHVKERIHTLVSNGLSGLVLVIATLFFFLNMRVALWVTMGIPVSFLTTLGLLWLFGGSINMISLFGLILALGLIVDDAIVVGEDTLTHLQQGESAQRAALGGAKRMFWPVVASSTTTIAAFLPLGMMGGAMGKIAFDIPFVMICVIIASLMECFLVLPGHLHHAFRGVELKPSALRQRIDGGFDRLREQRFRPLVYWAIRNRVLVSVSAICAFVLALSVVATGWLKFTFFPPVDSDQIRAVAEFSAGTDTTTVDHFLDQLERTLNETNQELGGHLVHTVISHHGAAAGFPNIGGRQDKFGDEFGTLVVEVYTGADREITNDELMQAWRQKLKMPAGLDQLTITQGDAGPPGKPVEIKLTGSDVPTLKQASLELQDRLSGFAGISNVDDDLPYGKEQLTFQLTPKARALGLTLSEVASQLRAAFDGSLAQLYNDEDEEIEVRVILPDAERRQFTALERLPIITREGEAIPLRDVVHFKARKGVDLLRRVGGQLAVTVSADLDPEQGNANEIIATLQQGLLPKLQARYGVGVDYEGKLQEQAENLRDMATGALLGLALIYVILAWVFSAYTWPLAIMTAIFFGFTGAVIGHLLTAPFGIKFSMFSIMGLFGLSGIIVNDSIVLVSFYQQLVAEGMERYQAIVEACVRRLRAVLLTSITTVAGLLPILFETSLQAQFLKPMAVSIVFGLLFGTGLILLVVPAMLMIIEEQQEKLHGLRPSSLIRRLPGLWRFDPHQHRQQPIDSGFRGSLRWAAIAAALLLALTAARLPVLQQAHEQAQPLPLVLLAALLLVTMLALGLAVAVQLWRRWHRTPSLASLWLSVTVLGSLLIRTLLPEQAGPFWSLALWGVFAALLILPALHWGRRSAHTLTRGHK
ncbi:cation multi-drug efflux protein [Alcanivorax hongdengensis A-11-3]|uniref:Cation multi-drug efflux protein n=1 Tax=Alcanivorax hongdengensis A-11-3 TaxID=1177179 RepID=L0WD98_9GAMM|nr:efflux RND transporter permease subunit [Alcanivorax hongdengensis]EKF74738.1 cation multi-drug efflux protein [Alcanivorax hongdengensis A-11-3]